jgi:hypothetical protein
MYVEFLGYGIFLGVFSRGILGWLTVIVPHLPRRGKWIAAAILFSK